MSLYDYRKSRELACQPGVSFYSLIMAAMRLADSINAEKLQQAFPYTWDELQHLYHTPGAMQDASEGGEEA